MLPKSSDHNNLKGSAIPCHRTIRRIHRPLCAVGFENTRLFGSTNTGLSQSDLSISSQGSVNPSYRYGNQVEYDAGHLGYPMYGGSYESDSLSRKLEGGSKWVEFDKSPDTEKTLLNVSKTSSMEKEGDESVSYSPEILLNSVNRLDLC